ncbi:MAG: ubiquinol-cytochrome c reductase iron-sulfur subunit [Planctomycetes bacterium]|nr:ubiquinol-cytochrome c reductase iron-sulfur subunit [Planctomycetota bacterium]
MMTPDDPESQPPPMGDNEPSSPSWLIGEVAATPAHAPDAAVEKIDRRDFLARATSVAMGASLVAVYGAFAAMAGRFLYPARPALKGWLYVADVAGFKRGASLSYTAPDGATVAIARPGEAGKVEDFIALSSTCPHLGCKVHWEGQNQRFFCPCHNGAFDPSGRAIAGPPQEAGQSLGKYPLRIDGGLLYIEVPLEGLPGPGEA